MGLLKKWIVIIVLTAMFGYVAYDSLSNKEESKSEDTVAVSSEEINDSEQSTGLELGETAPDFSLTDMDGEEVQLSDFRGQKVLLNFWATWCPPCRAEMPDLQAFHEDYEDVEILGVNLTDTESHEKNLPEFLDEFGITFSILKDMDTSVATTYSAHALPTSYIIDRDGKVFNKAIGPLNYDSMVDVFGQID